MDTPKTKKSSAPVSDQFEIEDRNRVRRVFERAHYDKQAIYDILDSHALCHIAYTIDSQPFCTPTLYWREDDTLFWHGSSASRMLKYMAKEMPVCLTVSHLDGLVLARSAFHHSVEYRSAMCFGTAHLIEKEDEKEAALHAMIERFYPGRNEKLRPMKSIEIKQTKVIAMQIENAVAKCRNAGVKDDEEDYNQPVWAGVIPLKTILEPAVPCPRLADDQNEPDNIGLYKTGASLNDIFQETQRLYEKTLKS